MEECSFQQPMVWSLESKIDNQSLHLVLVGPCFSSLPPWLQASPANPRPHLPSALQSHLRTTQSKLSLAIPSVWGNHSLSRAHASLRTMAGHFKKNRSTKQFALKTYFKGHNQEITLHKLILQLGGKG